MSLARSRMFNELIMSLEWETWGEISAWIFQDENLQILFRIKFFSSNFLATSNQIQTHASNGKLNLLTVFQDNCHELILLLLLLLFILWLMCMRVWERKGREKSVSIEQFHFNSNLHFKFFFHPFFTFTVTHVLHFLIEKWCRIFFLLKVKKSND